LITDPPVNSLSYRRSIAAHIIHITQKRWMLLLKIDEWPPAMRIDCCVWGCGGLPCVALDPPFILSFKHPIPHPPSELHQMKTSQQLPLPLFLPKIVKINSL
jgi:hypothetical protein